MKFIRVENDDEELCLIPENRIVEIKIAQGEEYFEVHIETDAEIFVEAFPNEEGADEHFKQLERQLNG